MTAFLVVGIVGTAIIVLSLVFGDLLEGVFDSIDVDAGSGALSGPVIGSFLSAAGFGGALVMAATDSGALIGALGGGAVGLAMAGLALLLTRSLMRMSTDASVRLEDLVARSGTVVTPIPDGGLGEVSLVHLGQRMKLNARAEARKREAILASEGQRAATIAAAEANAEQARLSGEGERSRRQALAQAEEIEGRAQGLAEQARREAIAAAIEREGQAEAAAILAKGQAEAEAMEKRAEATGLSGHPTALALHQGVLWFGTQDRAVTCIDPETGTVLGVVELPEPGDHPVAFAGLPGSDGVLAVGSNGRVHRFDRTE